MRRILFILTCLVCFTANGQYPYARKLSYPDQLPTYKVFDMLTDSKGYIWLGTDKGLYRFNGHSFVAIPFTTTSLPSVSYLQEDESGTIWCMNFHNQLFYYGGDSLRLFETDLDPRKGNFSFQNVSIGKKFIWFSSFGAIYQFDKKTHKKTGLFTVPGGKDMLSASGLKDNVFHTVSSLGFVFQGDDDHHNKWKTLNQDYQLLTPKMLAVPDGMMILETGLKRRPTIIVQSETSRKLPPPRLPSDVYIFQAVYTGNNMYWLCTQAGAYAWDPVSGITKCYLPGERVSDVIQDYQGNFWFSTLDNGIYVCSSLLNELHKVYNDPLKDNFTRLEALPSGNIIVGNTHGLISRVNFDQHSFLHYNVSKNRETEFIKYDTLEKLIFCNRGVFKEDQRDAVALMDYSKGVSRDAYNNILIAVFNGAFVLNNKYGITNRLPESNNELYRNAYRLDNGSLYDRRSRALLLRTKRSSAILGARAKNAFWVAFEDDLYEYRYDGSIRILKDADGNHIIGKFLLELADGRLLVGTSNKGVLVLKNGVVIKRYGVSNGLSNQNIRKIILDGSFIWVLTDAGFDKVDLDNDAITNYLGEYGLSDVIINDVVLTDNKIMFATPAGILVRLNVPQNARYQIRFPLLKAFNDGIQIETGCQLRSSQRNISFYFEALHYVSPDALMYRYRMNGVDTQWHTINSEINQAVFNRLSSGDYRFEIQAFAGVHYRSEIRSFNFSINKSVWQKWWVWGIILSVVLLGFQAFLVRWKKRVMAQQEIKEQLLKSQLVALRAQMNPHFLYNVLNTVQGLVYGNRRAAASELLGNFSDLMRKVLQSSDTQFLSLKDEVENLRLYLELEKARFDEGFSYSLQMQDIEDTSQVYVPSLLLQPFAENAIKHGLMHKTGNKILDIIFRKSEDGVLITIDDNGIGRQRSMEINQRKPNKPTAFATQAISERMELFNRLYKSKIRYTVTDKFNTDQQPAGTRIELFIPEYQPKTGPLWEKSAGS